MLAVVAKPEVDPPPFWLAYTQIPPRAAPPTAAVTVPVIVPPCAIAASIDAVVPPAVTDTGFAEAYEDSLSYHWVT